jgi:hypothetical protein
MPARWYKRAWHSISGRVKTWKPRSRSVGSRASRPRPAPTPQRVPGPVGQAVQSTAADSQSTDASDFAGSSPEYERITKALGTVLAQTALATAMLYYFGYARTQSLFGYFGVDPTLVGFSTQDYVLRSIDSSVPAMFVLGCAYGVLFALGLALRRIIKQWPRFRPIAIWPVALVGVAAAAAGVAAWDGRVHVARGWQAPGLIAVGLSVSMGSYYLSRVPRRDSQPTTSTTLRVLAILLIGTATAWAWADYARDVGLVAGRNFAASLPSQTSVSLYSKDPLGLAYVDEQTGRVGVEALSLDPSLSQYRVRYDRLRLLIRTKDKDLILLPWNWRKGAAPVFIVHDDDSVRLDMRGS